MGGKLLPLIVRYCDCCCCGHGIPTSIGGLIGDGVNAAVPPPERSARRLKVSLSTITISLGLSPSPSPLSGSFDVTETRVMDETSAVALNAASTVTYLWFGGHRISGDTVTVKDGGSAQTHDHRVMIRDAELIGRVQAGDLHVGVLKSVL